MRLSMKRFLLYGLCMGLLFASQNVSAHAQVSSAQITGIVTDSTGAAVPQAKALIVSQDTGVSRIAFSLVGAPSRARLGLTFEWVADRSTLGEVSPGRLNYRFRDFDYDVRVANGAASKTSDGVNIVAGKRGALRMLMVQTS